MNFENVCLRFLLVLGLVMGESSFGAKQSKESKPEPDADVFTIAVPQSQLKLEPMEIKPPKPIAVELSVSPYAPDHFARTDFRGHSSEFVRTPTPLLSLNQITEWSHLENGLVIASRIGLSYTQLERTAQLHDSTSGTTIGTDRELLNIFLFRAAAEVAWREVLPWHLEPVFSAALVPTVGLAQASSFEANVSATGIGFESTLGLRWLTDAWGQPLALGLEGQSILGTVGGSNLGGSALLLSLRMYL